VAIPSVDLGLEVQAKIVHEFLEKIITSHERLILLRVLGENIAP